MYQYSKAILLSTALGGFSCVAASADENSGFSFNLGHELYDGTPYNLSVPITSLVDNEFLLSQNVFPPGLDFSLEQRNGINAALNWRSAVMHTGPFNITFGATVSLSYYNESFVDADFTNDVETLRRNIIDRATEEANRRFVRYGEPLGISAEDSRKVFYDIASYVVRNPYEIRTLSPEEINALIPDDLPDEIRQRIITDATPVIVDASRALDESDVVRGLRDLYDFQTDYSGPAQSLAFHAEVFARAALDTYPVAPYIQGNLGYQALGFMTDNDDGGVFHGPTASLSLGLTADFNITTIDVFVKQPFALEQQGPYGLTAESPDDLIIGFDLPTDFVMPYSFVAAEYIPEQDSRSITMGLNFNF
ncbi:MAG: hypothetical protein AAF988_04350 [Pseudomonadota bacterium]